MKNKFLGYHPLSSSDIAEIWNRAIFSFDTNSLLNLYRYTKPTRESMFELIHKIKDNIWIPHQVALEFYQNRPSVISDQESAYDSLSKELNSALEAIKQAANKFQKHSFIATRSITKELEDAISSKIAKLAELKESHPNHFSDDKILLRISDLLDGCVGEEYDDKTLHKIYAEGKTRYEKKMPPGYADDKLKQEEHRKYGDLVIWYQLIEKASKEQRPLIFVTDDQKEDWWLIHKGKTLGPRPELIKEFKSKTGKLAYLYSPEKFIQYAKDKFDQKISAESVNEIVNISNELNIARHEMTTPWLGVDNSTQSEAHKIIFQMNDHESSISSQIKKMSDKLHAAQTLSKINIQPQTTPPTGYDLLSILANIAVTNTLAAMKIPLQEEHTQSPETPTHNKDNAEK